MLVPAVVLTASGCSFGIQGPDPDRPRNEVPKCDTGKGSVTMDGLMATLLGVASLASFSGDETGGGVALGGLSALFVAAAVRGNNAANSCRDAYSEYNVAYAQARRQQLAIEPEPKPAAPRIVTKPKPKPVEPPPVDPAQQPVVEPVAPEPVPASTYASPRPPIVAKPKPAPKPAPSQPADDDWGAFWKEAP